jgi:hypothetical protein
VPSTACVACHRCRAFRRAPVPIPDMDDEQAIRDSAFVLSARPRFDELAAAIRTNLYDDGTVVELHHWLADVQPKVVDTLDPAPERSGTPGKPACARHRYRGS